MSDEGVSSDTHEQAMACLGCGLAGLTPPAHFPQPPGLWNERCPLCGELKVWVTDVRPKAPPEPDPPQMTLVRARALVEEYLAARLKRGNRRGRGAGQ